jgi:protein-tyrosine phosphatase
MKGSARKLGQHWPILVVVMTLPFRILCVCMGNICRSPTAEVVLRQKLRESGLGDKVEVDSAATHGYHVGEISDSRIQRLASERGYDLSQHRARKIGWQDFDYFDLILAMDKRNLYNLQRNATEAQQGKIKLFMEYAQHFDEAEIPDPHTTLGERFEHVLALIEDASVGLVKNLKVTLNNRGEC